MIVAAAPIDADQLRLRHEFLALPGLVLTTTQVARLLDIRFDHAEALLASLQDQGFLAQTPGGTFRRAQPLMS
jgi:hypothetical protein